MATSGVTFEEQLGMLTGVTEITRNASTATRGLTMISSRLTQVLDDTSSTGKKLTAIYEKLGISLKDDQGQLRSTYDILKDLAAQWNNLSSNEQKYIALTSAGARQQQNFVALMKNFNTVMSATATAYNSVGSAQKENEKVMDTVAKKLEILKSEFQQLVIGKGGLQELVKDILDVGIALLKFANSDVGKVIIKITAFIAAVSLAKKGINALIPVFAKMAGAMSASALASNATAASLAGLTGTSSLASVAVSGLSSAFTSLTAAMASNPVGLIAVALAALAAGAIAAHNAVEKLQKRVEEAKKDVIELTSEIRALHEQEKEEGKLTPEEKARLKYLEKRLELEKALIEAHSFEHKPLSYATGNAPQSEGVAYGANAPTPQTGGGTVGQTHTPTNKGYSPTLDNAVLNESISAYSKLNKEIAEWNDNSEKGMELLQEKYEESQRYIPVLEGERDRLARLKEQYTQNNTEYTNLINKQNAHIPLTEEEALRLSELEDATRQLSVSDELRLETLEEYVGAYQRSIDEIESYSEAVDEYGEESEEADSILAEFAKDLGITEEELIANAEAAYMSIDAYHDYATSVKATQDAIKNTSTSIDGLQDALTKAQTAFDEYNEQGYLTLDTFQDLMGVSAEYLTALVNEEGQLEVNQETLGNLVEALKKQKVEELQAAEVADILAYAMGDVDSMSSLAKNSIADAGASAKTAGNNAQAGSSGFWSLAEAISAANAAAKGDVLDASHVEANIQKIHKAYSDLGSSIFKTKVNTTAAGNAATKAGKKGAGAAKQAKDATEELNKELEETKKNYEKVISFITGRIDKHTKAIKKEKDTAIDAIEEEIKAREEQKDKESDALEEQINALEKLKDARKKYWDDQIDALKKANQERKDALELQEKLDALEKAKNTKVKIYKEGKGFVYDVDQTAVAEAQKALDEYLSEKAYEDELERLNNLKDAEIDNYDKRLDALNEYKDNVKKSYEEQIDALEKQKEALEKQYDAQIEYYENFKEQFEDMVKAYEDKQTELLASQLTGINFENDNWMTRLDNLAKFVSEYNKLQEQLNTKNTNVTNTATMSTPSGGSGGGGGKSSSTKSKNIGGSSSTGSTNQGGAGSRSGSAGLQTSALAANRKRVLGYANGVSSVKDNEIAIVGENPNKEIVIGSKVNNGQLMSLSKGTGVVNAESTNALAGMLNQVGKFGASEFGSGNGTLNNNINNDSLVINGVTIQGADIKDPQSFANGLMNLKAEALQRAYRHR